MKKFYMFICALFLACGVFAQDANRMFYAQLVQPDTGSVASVALDVSAYKGNAAFVVQLGPDVSYYTNTVTLAHATTAGGTYATITNINGTSGAVMTVVGTNEYTTVVFPCDTGRLRKFVKATVTKNPAGSDAPVSVLFVAPSKSQ